MNKNPISLTAIRGFHIGGEQIKLTGQPIREMTKVVGAPALRVDMNGDHWVGQLYCQHFEQTSKGFAYPVILMHGGGLTGACWENTPDGREGWLNHFLRERYELYVCDAFERGRASWPPFPQVLPDAPEHRPLDAVWHHFRFGPADSYISGQCEKTAYPGQLFPVSHLSTFGQQFVPRWAGTDRKSLNAYGALIESIGPCLLIGHSQGAYYAMELATQYPDLIKGVVAIEPPAVPAATATGNHEDMNILPPHLAVWGDFIHGKNATWQGYLKGCERYFSVLKKTCPISRLDELPELGIQGNSHMMMLDKNSDIIAAHIQKWIQSIV